MKRLTALRAFPGWLTFTAVAVILTAIVWMLPFTVSSAGPESEAAPTRKVNDYYDIRDKKNDEARGFFDHKRQKLTGRQRSAIAGLGRSAEQAKSRLLRSNPGLEIQMSEDIGAAEVVSITAPGRKLTRGSKEPRENVVRGFLAANKELYGLSTGQAAQLKKVADYENPGGNLSWVEFEQQLNGVPVFQGTILAALTRERELFRTTGKLVPGLDTQAPAGESFFGAAENSTAASAADAVAAAARSIGVEMGSEELVLKEIDDDGRTVIFEAGPFANDIKAEMIYFPLEAGTVALAWSTTLWQDVPAYYTILDAETGTLLWRKNITDEQTQGASYGIYDDDSPAPLSPSNALPGLNVQAPAISRTTYNLISEHPSNALGWLTDGATTTTGNNVDAGLDIVSPNGIDTGGRPVSSTRNFVYDFNPSPGLPGATGSSNPSDTNYRWGAVTNIFFWSNRFHDRMYELGFTEAARNFQQNNFGRNPGGATANARNGNDRVLAEAQDYSGTNNANFSTPADGSSGRMQMYLWPNSNRDGDFDNDIVIHELAHGLSNRLHNNASGLGTVYSRGMGEGWSDFYARALLSTADEDVNGIYTVGGYATHLAATGYTNNYYYGIRRFPYAVKSNVGANGRPHNPLTYADTNPNTIDLTDGAFARGPFGTGGRAGSVAVHNIGEVWNMALLEVRALMINRLGYEIGNQRMLQIVTDGMKLNPVNPTLVQSRNALIAAAAGSFTAEEVQDIWKGFALRGIGYGATSPTTTNANTRESFDNPIPGLGSVAFADCSGNLIASPGESLTLTVPLTNPLGIALSDVTATVGDETVSYGTIPPGATVTHELPFAVSPSATIGTTIVIPIVVESNLGTETKTYEIEVEGAPNLVTFAQNFDGVTAPALPAGWSALVNPAGSPVWRTVNTSTQSAPNAAFVNFLATTSLSFLQSPAISVTSPNARLTFRHSYNSEFEWDGAILQISLDGGTTYLDILDSGAGARFLEGGYPFVLKNASADGNTNLLQNRAAWTGNSGGFITTTVQLPAAAAGRDVLFRWIAGADSAITVTNSGWTIDNVALVEGYQSTSVATTTSVSAVAGQYSDEVTLSATIGAGCLNPVGNVEFKVNGVSVATVAVNGGGTYTTPYTITLAPGNHTVTADFVGTNSYFQNSNGSNTLTVNREDASVAFPSSNPVAVKVNAAGGTAGPITICADITEIADGSAGDTTNATAAFAFNPVAGGNAPTPGVVTYSGGGIGATRRACTTVSNVRVDVYDVTVTVGGYYTGSGSTVLAVYDPSLGFVTGGGTVENNGNTANFGINIKYLKNGRPQGSILYIEHRPDGEVKIKSNSLDSLSIVGNTAVILTKATLNGVGNHNVRMTVVDSSESGATDQFGLQTSTPAGASIPELTFGLRAIAGGNIQVPQRAR